MRIFDMGIEALRESCFLASIAHAIMMTKYSEFDYEQSWDGLNYSINDGTSIRCTISFRESYCIGAIRDETANKFYFSHDTMKLLENATDDTKDLARNEAFQYLFDDVNGVADVSISCSFWGDLKGLYSMYNFDEFFQLGGRILKPYFLERKDAMEKWISYYGMNSNQKTLLEELFAMKSKRNTGILTLSNEQFLLLGDCEEKGLIASSQSFGEIGILFP